MFFKSTNSTVNETQVLQALSAVTDPDLKKDIVTLGFVKNIKITSQGEVTFDVELTTPACPVKEALKEECEFVVKKIPGVKSAVATMKAQVRAAGQFQPNRIALPQVKNVIAVASGKGGVGKSTVTVNLAASLAETGAQVGLLDADIYGPSIPTMLGIHERPLTQGEKLIPIVRDNLKIISMGFLVPENQPIVWRGPMVHSALTQFMMQVEWGDLDYLLIDMPPGTGDAQLTISQNAPLAGAIIVTTPQEISLLDARRGLMMFQSVKVPILGVIENMSGFKVPGTQEVVSIFKQGGGQKISNEMKVPFLGSVPIEPEIAVCGDEGIPLVWRHKESEAAKSFKKIAGQVAAELSVMSVSQGFKSVSLEWNP